MGLKPQPTSRIRDPVRSAGTATLWMRSPVSFGSINWFGKSTASKCETDDPEEKLEGAYTCGRPCASTPAAEVLSNSSVALTPAPSWLLIVLPSLKVTINAGIVMVGS